jgi:hypothetical protein
LGDSGLEEIYLRGCINDFLPALNFWWSVAGEIAHVFDRPAFDPQRENLVALLDDVMKAFAPAEKDALFTEGCYAPLELLRRYGLYRRYVIQLAAHVWPFVNWRETLDKLV